MVFVRLPVLFGGTTVKALSSIVTRCLDPTPDNRYQGKKFRESGPGEGLNAAKSSNATVVLVVGLFEKIDPLPSCSSYDACAWCTTCAMKILSR